MTEIIQFQCEECKNRNYSSTKDKKKLAKKLEFKKYCKHCQRHTVHKEVK